MKKIPIIIVVLFCISCANKDSQEKELIETKITEIPDGYVVHNIELLYDLGAISIATPKEYDTLYSWVNMSDICIADKQMYRIANKHYSLLNEDGAWYRREFDSLKQVTISHSFPRCYFNGIPEYRIDTLINNRIIENQKFLYPSLKTELNEISIINGKEVGIVALSGFEDEIIYTEMYVFFVINGQICLIEFECYCSDCSNFISEMHRSIKTLRIKEGKGYLTQVGRHVLSFIAFTNENNSR